MPNVDGRCAHGKEEIVTTYAGDVVAYRCTDCATIMAHQGKCDGCGKDKRLRVHIAASRRRYCTEDCRAAAQARARAEASAPGTQRPVWRR